jgi:hypothetical protein
MELLGQAVHAARVRGERSGVRHPDRDNSQGRESKQRALVRRRAMSMGWPTYLVSELVRPRSAAPIFSFDLSGNGMLLHPRRWR